MCSNLPHGSSLTISVSADIRFEPSAAETQKRKNTFIAASTRTIKHLQHVGIATYRRTDRHRDFSAHRPCSDRRRALDSLLLVTDHQVWPRKRPKHALPERPCLNAERHDPARHTPRTPLRDHVANSVRRYLGDLNGSGTTNLYEIALRELEIPLFAEVLEHCDGNQSRAAAMLGIHRATLRKKLKDYGLG
jgi:Fis family transcriptional regulator, factor for inversion stimulation protein